MSNERKLFIAEAENSLFGHLLLGTTAYLNFKTASSEFRVFQHDPSSKTVSHLCSAASVFLKQGVV